MTERQKAYLETVLGSKRGVVTKALSGKSRACAIRAKCFDCVGFEDVTNRVRNCECEICPLWPYRPFQTDDAELDDPLESNSLNAEILVKKS